MSVLNSVPLLLIELDLSLRRLTNMAQTVPPPPQRTIFEIYVQGKLSVEVLELGNRAEKHAIMETLIKNHNFMEKIGMSKIDGGNKRAILRAIETRVKRPRRDLFCNETI